MSRRGQPNATELVIVSEQLRRVDGKFAFRVLWQVGRTGHWKSVKGHTYRWLAGSTEEMLAAIQAAKIAIDSMPGIKALPKGDADA